MHQHSIGLNRLGSCPIILRIVLIAFAMVQLFHLNQPQAIALMAFSSLPTASSCYVLAVRMGYEGSFVASLVSLSTMLGVLSLPFGLWLIGI